MLKSLLALPLGVGAEILVFLLLYRLSPLHGKQAAALVGALAIAAVLIYSLVTWPGADVLAMYIAVLAVTAYLLGILGHTREQRLAAPSSKERWFHWGPAIIIMFFAVLFVVDGVLVKVAKDGLPQSVADRLLPKFGQTERIQSAFPGTVANDFHKKESLYNEHLEKLRRQEQLGWKVEKGWLGKPVQGRPAAFQARVLEADGAPVRFAKIHGVFQRASNSREDIAFDMQEVEPGLYRAVVVLSKPGMWYLAMKVSRGEQLHELHGSTSVTAQGQ